MHFCAGEGRLLILDAQATLACWTTDRAAQVFSVDLDVMPGVAPRDGTRPAAHATSGAGVRAPRSGCRPSSVLARTNACRESGTCGAQGCAAKAREARTGQASGIATLDDDAPSSLPGAARGGEPPAPWLVSVFNRDGTSVVCASADGRVLTLDAASSACQGAVRARSTQCRPVLSDHQHAAARDACVIHCLESGQVFFRGRSPPPPAAGADDAVVCPTHPDREQLERMGLRAAD